MHLIAIEATISIKNKLKALAGKLKLVAHTDVRSKTNHEIYVDSISLVSRIIISHCGSVI